MNSFPRFPLSLPCRKALVLAGIAITLLATTAPISAGDSPGAKHSSCDRLHSTTILQLESARQAAARFFDVQVALDEGYIDIDLFVPQMGWHFLNPGLRDDGRFDPAKPELLVYQEDCDGTLRLVAVEYAVPTELSSRAPRGFFGADDRWHKNTEFKLWTLHAWVYDFNPHGVFADLNPRLP